MSVLQNFNCSWENPGSSVENSSVPLVLHSEGQLMQSSPARGWDLVSLLAAFKVEQWMSLFKKWYLPLNRPAALSENTWGQITWLFSIMVWIGSPREICDTVASFQFYCSFICMQRNCQSCEGSEGCTLSSSLEYAAPFHWNFMIFTLWDGWLVGKLSTINLGAQKCQWNYLTKWMAFKT